MPKPRANLKKRRRPQVAQRPPSQWQGTVRDVTRDGRAVVAAPNGQVVLVPGAWHGEIVEVRAHLHGRGAIEGLLLDVIEPHEARIAPACPHSGAGDRHCGGCAWSFVSYAAQCDEKRRQLAQRLQRLDAQDIRADFIAAPEPWGYRVRAQLKSDGRTLGYLAARSHHLIDITQCPVLSPKNQILLARLREKLPHRDWQPKGRAQWTTLDIDDHSDLISTDQRLPFRQGNASQNERLKQWLSQQLSGLSVTRAVELFAGSGNLTECLVAADIETIYALEGVAEAVADTATLPRVTGLAVDLFNDASVRQFVETLEPYDLLLLDPPREGLKVRAPWLLPGKRPRTVIYISCDLATWARDVADFQQAGYQLTEVTGLDMYPQTPHVEVLSVLTDSC